MIIPISTSKEEYSYFMNEAINLYDILEEKGFKEDIIIDDRENETPGYFHLKNCYT